MDLHTILHTAVSDFQEVQVIESYFGRTLVTDGKTQSAEHDEFVYHESLVHPALFCGQGGAPKSVFIGGGGELATAREVLRHSTIERCVMVDIDPAVVNVCKKYLPEWGGQAVIDHPKMEYIAGDAHKYLMETNEKFDVIIMDISDPIEAGPGVALYTQEFYQRAAEVLNKPHGVFVTQAGSADFETCCFSPIKNTLGTVFDHAIPYSCPIASFGEDWGYVMAFNGDPSQGRKLADLSRESVDELIEERIRLVLKHYDGVSHRRLFALSKPLREAMKSDERIMTEANPIFMY
ncbi:spermidine synthase [Thalassiosira pseudonana CCMP1335]|uniref:thermospermine synthase n=1 Tax=Thalassiosira pseudonana TaxID=35128 RepID=B8CE12_THAPS|nr:spermidine synthase [Thalassiosira pseudonana CCMP1335]EED88302.1 spermidine synthase [Thalassiosira pseudonana CCMP1335]